MGAARMTELAPSDYIMGNLYQDLLHFTDPSNPFGFRARYCFWVITEWRGAVHYPDPTNPGTGQVPLRDVCQNVHDVMATFNGRVLRGAGGNPILERRWDDVNALFEDACIEFMLGYQDEQVLNSQDPVVQAVAADDWLAAIYRDESIDPDFDYWAMRIRSKFSDGSSYFRSLYGDSGFGEVTLADLQCLMRDGVIEHGQVVQE